MARAGARRAGQGRDATWSTIVVAARGETRSGGADDQSGRISLEGSGVQRLLRRFDFGPDPVVTVVDQHAFYGRHMGSQALADLIGNV